MINPLTHRKILKKGRPGRATVISSSVPERGASSFNVAMTLHVYVEGMSPYEVQEQWMVKARDYGALRGSIPVKVDAEDPTRVAIDWDTLRAEHEQQDDARRAALAAQGPVTDPDAAAATGILGALGLGNLANMPGVGVDQQFLSSDDVSVQGSTAAVDARDDPELRAKLQEALGYELVPGQSITVTDPAQQQLIMQVVSAHAAAKAAGAPSPPAAPDAGDGGDGGDDTGDLIARLERLTALRDAGALTPEEFESTKQRLLAEG